ncbi:uncharacterized protein FFE2_16031 [Fusarium fujikuroi]|nr:uncharacterized protein FFE2_16031 [Fusarium fujikuroi]
MHLSMLHAYCSYL